MASPLQAFRQLNLIGSRALPAASRCDADHVARAIGHVFQQIWNAAGSLAGSGLPVFQDSGMV